MDRIKILAINIVIIMIAFVHISYAEQRSGYGTPLATYETPMGVKFVSFSSKWGTKEKLQEVSNEFSKNFMSSEISYLNSVYFYPDTPDGVAGFYKPSIKVDTMGNYTYTKNNYIEIFNCNTYGEISDIAKVLSHEYGHHFTMYYLIAKEGKYFSEWKTTEYAKIRGLTNFSKAKYYDDLYEDNYEHKWDVTEIAAEDYVQLFGSPLSKKSVDYMDVKDRVEKNISDYRYSSNSFNLLPQENLDIPLAVEVKGLRQYWLSLAGYNTKHDIIPNRPTLELMDEKTILNKYKSYKIAWNKVLGDDEYEYTLVMYPEGDNSFPIPIKTANSGEELSAYVGSYMITQTNGGAKVIMENYKGRYLLRLFIKDKNNFMFSSREYKIDFSAGITMGTLQLVYSANAGNVYQNEFSLFTDMNTSHWAYNYVKQLVNLGVVKGYTDGTYKPEGSITKAEFLALTLRTLKVNLTKYKESSSTDWFVRDGYYGAAIGTGIITQADYGKNFINLNANNKITRDEMALIAGRAIVYMNGDQNNIDNFVNGFTDINQIKYITQLNITVKYGIISGYTDGTFRPTNTATRAEASKIVYKLKAAIGG